MQADRRTCSDPREVDDSGSPPAVHHLQRKPEQQLADDVVHDVKVAATRATLMVTIMVNVENNCEEEDHRNRGRSRKR